MIANVIADSSRLSPTLRRVSGDGWAAHNVNIFERYPGVFPLRYNSGFEDNLGTSLCGQVTAQRVGNRLLFDNSQPQVDHLVKREQTLQAQTVRDREHDRKESGPGSNLRVCNYSEKLLLTFQRGSILFGSSRTTLRMQRCHPR